MPTRVLIVDDCDQTRGLVREFLLSECGFSVCGEASDGFDAITKAKLLKPDLIVLEVSIPRLNGIEVASKLKKLLPETPIILFTCYGALLKGCDVREIGADAVVAKQEGISALADCLHILLGPSPQSRTSISPH
jgi:DNA-binding NarL/FixJ family response regulator